MEPPVDAAVERLIAPVVDHVCRHDPGALAGFYLYGSAVTRLNPDSDIDLLLLTHRSLTSGERAAIIGILLEVSGWHDHAERFPEAADRRPIELTSVVLGDVSSWPEWPTRDFQYGEWMRAEFVEGGLSPPARDHDVVTLLATAQAEHRALIGPALSDLVAAVPRGALRDAVLAGIPDLLDDIAGDERNTLLTLARAVVTIRDGRIVAKDVAAEEVIEHLDGHGRSLLAWARDGYRGIVVDDWSDRTAEAHALAHRLAELAGSLDD
ncbi:hypothetical protein BHE97_12070 [Aeromicrobium sp. PE09-221]|uniref:aminoglycoside adenylyltransferase domain-containing protein n=1 Tax=Aeromicrobium sp. PE09-221 TaxID=1898043 RepID=UPI000B3E881B|nr:aminoglycoside adenylyltransferase domain-containing protein [Aeromicrobium sp. PE09-221]OUZ08863.1 hypothetical protein BHE97_12070 [Aeromicrobium sp. PE09-221]